MLKLSNLFFFLFFFLQIGFSQKTHQKQNSYFLFPLRLPTLALLAGNMGELRDTHFHAGIDIKTNGRQKISVVAAANGYVSRIKISPDGYGNVLYITHPNGLVTVYAHLHSFSKKIQTYVLSKQYALETFDIELFPFVNQFLFKQGDTIALSGNTGSSSGPHLHFEVRDSLENFLDPLSFGFLQIKDKLPPIIEKVAIQTLDINARVDGEFNRLEYIPRFLNGVYRLDTIYATGVIGFEIVAHDKMDYVNHMLGVKSMEVKIDNQLIYSHYVNCLSFYCNNHLFVHTDFSTASYTGKKFQRLFVADGNEMKIYKTNELLGRYHIQDTLFHKVVITCKDANGNSSSVQWIIKGDAKSKKSIFSKSTSSQFPQFDFFENILKVSIPSQALIAFDKGKIYKSDSIYSWLPSYKKGNAYVYLWDVRTFLPDSFSIDTFRKVIGIKKIIYPNREQVYQTENIALFFTPNTLFDTLLLEVVQENNRLRIGTEKIPLAAPLFVKTKLLFPLSISLRSKLAVYSFSHYRLIHLAKINWDEDYFSFQTNQLGTFLFLTDTIPPRIEVIKKLSHSISFKISDNLSGIESFKAFINGNWLLMNYDRKTGRLWSQSSKNESLKGKFILEVKDRVGNIQKYRTLF